MLNNALPSDLLQNFSPKELLINVYKDADANMLIMMVL